MLAIFFITRDPQWFKHILTGDLELFTIWPFVLVLSPFFAWLTSWGQHDLGPVRLYLGGFLLPYLVWGLIIIIDVGEEKAGNAVRSPAMQQSSDGR